MMAAPRAAVRWGSGGTTNLVAPDLLQRLDEAFISRPTAHHGHFAFHPHSFGQSIDLGRKGPMKPCQKILFFHTLRDPGDRFRFRERPHIRC